MVRKKFKGTIALFLVITIIILLLGFASACVCGNGVLEAGEECDDGNLINGDGCSDRCLIEEPCYLQLTKSVNNQNPELGDIIIYTLKYKNIGDRICTGGGVKIQDVLNNNLEYTGVHTKTITGDSDGQEIDSGWYSIPGYSSTTNTLTWNAHVVSPGEEGTIMFEARILEPAECGDFQINNYFKAWSDQEGWKNSNIVNVFVNNDCLPEPFCGNGIPEEGEQCDLGAFNGFLCWAGYGTSCTYCTIDCKLKTITNYCGDGILNSACEECDDGNLINGDGCSDQCLIEEPPEPECDHEIAVKYTYTDTFNTGIGVSENDLWLDNPVILTKGEIHSIKYRIDNKEEDDDNVLVTVKLGENVLSEYYKLINQYHTKTLDLDISNLQCNAYYTISVAIESDGFECDLTDNYASRQIYIECEEEPLTPYCGDGVCNGDEDCSTCPEDCGDCPPVCSVCGNGILEAGEECDDGNLIDGDGCSSKCKIEKDKEDYKAIKSVEFVQFCNTNWKCTGWSECSDGISTRSCYDKNNCDIKYNKPIEQMDCENFSKVYADDSGAKPFWIFFGIILFILLVLVLINLL